MKKGYKQCPYCGEEIREVAKKCRYCGEFLEEEKEIKKNMKISRIVQEGDKTDSYNDSKLNRKLRGKSLTVYDLPNERAELNERQKELLFKNFPLQGWYKVLVFIFPGIFLIWSRNGVWLILLLLIGALSGIENMWPIISIVLVAIRIFICIKWESICYPESVNMKKLLVENEDLWNKESASYDDSEITGHISKWWISLRVILIIFILFALLGFIL